MVGLILFLAVLFFSIANVFYYAGLTPSAQKKMISRSHGWMAFVIELGVYFVIGPIGAAMEALFTEPRFNYWRTVKNGIRVWRSRNPRDAGVAL
jgi:hypothetical protein